MTDATHMPAGEPLERIQCQWCQGMNEKTALSCRSCGAPLDIRNLVSESGWREAPRIKDMTEFQFSSSTCQVEGEIVPVAEIHLGAGDSVFFEHHIMLWKEDSVPLTVLQLPGGMKRAFAGMPFIISVATGPGRIAFSRPQLGNWWCSRCIPEWKWTRASMPSCWPRTRSIIPLCASRDSPTSSSAARVCTWTASLLPTRRDW